MFFHQESQDSGVYIAHARTHHKAFGRSQAHRCIHAFAVVYGRNAAAVAYMAGDDAFVGDVTAQDLAYALANVAVAGAVEAVSAHAVFLVETIGQWVDVRLGRHCLVECGVEDAYLGHVGQYGFNGFDAGHIGGVVQRSQDVALTYHVFDGFVDKDTLVEFFAAMYQAMTYGLNLAIVLDTSFGGVGEQVKYGLDRAFMVCVA